MDIRSNDTEQLYAVTGSTVTFGAEPAAPRNPIADLYRARAEQLVEHFPGEHAARDAGHVRGTPNRHDLRRQLLRQAEVLEALVRPTLDTPAAEIRAYLQATGWELRDGWWHSPRVTGPDAPGGVSVFAILDDRFDREPELRDPGIREIERAESCSFGRMDDGEVVPC